MARPSAASTVFRRGAKEKFVVIASAENGAAALFFRKSAKRLGLRTSVPLHDGTHAASLENVSEVLQKTVRNVNGRVRETPQTATYGDARSRIVHAGSKLRQSPFGVEPNARADHEGRVGVPRRAGKPKLVADARPRASESLTHGHFPYGRDRKRHGRAFWRLDGVSAEECTAVSLGHFEESRSEGSKPRIVASGKRNGKEEGTGFGPGRREVGKIDGKRLSSHRSG